MKQSRHFPNQPDSVRAARHFATGALGSASGRVVSAVELMVSELATNCVRHTDAGFDLSVCQSAETIRVEVTDTGAGEPVVRSPALSEPTGRGLQLVQLMSEGWGVTRGPGRTGKTVWFTILAEAGREPARRAS